MSASPDNAKRTLLPRYLHRGGWRTWHFVALAVLGVGALLACFDAWTEVYMLARHNEEHSHILLVPIVTGWLWWVRRGRFAQCRPRMAWVGVLTAAAGGIIGAVGYRSSLETLWFLGAVLVFAGAVISVLGVEVVRRFGPAFGSLLFLVPAPARLWRPIASSMQDITARSTEAIFDLVGMGVTRSGNILSVNGVDVAIAEACNGLRMAFALMLVAFAFAFGSPLRSRVRWLIILLSPLSALVCNVVRLVPTVWLYGHDKAGLASTFHTVSGWVMVLLAYLLLLGVLRAMIWAMVPVRDFSLATD